MDLLPKENALQWNIPSPSAAIMPMQDHPFSVLLLVVLNMMKVYAVRYTARKDAVKISCRRRNWFLQSANNAPMASPATDRIARAFSMSVLFLKTLPPPMRLSPSCIGISKKYLKKISGLE